MQIIRVEEGRMRDRRWMLVVLAAALVLRWWTWPHRYEIRDVDEPGYLSSSLVLVEGMAPGYKPSPAGPEIWLGWIWAQAHIAGALLHPNVAHPPMQLRPFLAMNQGLFDLYHDLSGMRYLIAFANTLLLLAAVGAGFDYGRRRGGMAGGMLLAGLLACAPLLVQFSSMSRPYSMAWSFGVLAIAVAAAKSGKVRLFGAAILMGLAIGSRIEMILLLPVLLWEFWDWREKGGLGITWLKVAALSFLTAYIVAPWLLTGLPGNLRAIATIQLDNPAAAKVSTVSIIRDFAGTQGFGLVCAIWIAGMPLWVMPQQKDPHPNPLPEYQERGPEGGPERTRRVALAIFVFLLICTILKTTSFGLHQKGSAVLAMILTTPMAVTGLTRRFPKIVPPLVAAALLLPLFLTVRWSLRLPHEAPALADWVDGHVPANTTVYLHLCTFKAILPTAEAGDLIWTDVSGPEAWRRKFESGLKRFNLSADQIPRAMSEENLVQERGNERRWFILASAGEPELPRYRARIMNSSPVFEVLDVAGEFARTGGVVLWAPALDGPAPAEMGTPALTLPDADGMEVEVFCSPDVRLVL
jgi:hypothetical protein